MDVVLFIKMERHNSYCRLHKSITTAWNRDVVYGQVLAQFSILGILYILESLIFRILVLLSESTCEPWHAETNCDMSFTKDPFSFYRFHEKTKKWNGSIWKHVRCKCHKTAILQWNVFRDPTPSQFSVRMLVCILHSYIS